MTLSQHHTSTASMSKIFGVVSDMLSFPAHVQTWKDTIADASIAVHRAVVDAFPHLSLPLCMGGFEM